MAFIILGIQNIKNTKKSARTYLGTIIYLKELMLPINGKIFLVPVLIITAFKLFTPRE